MKEAIKTKAHLSKVVQDPAHNFFKVLKESILQEARENMESGRRIKEQARKRGRKGRAKRR